MQVILSLGFILTTMAFLFLLHILRTRRLGSPYVMFISFLWFLNFFTNKLGYSTHILGMDIRFSLLGYTMIFAAILIVYICEGIRESQNMILVSIGSQIIIILSMFFFNYSADFLIKGVSQKITGLIQLPDYLLPSPNNLAIAHQIFNPTAWQEYIVSITAAIVSLFFAVIFFQLLINKLKRIPKFILIFISFTSAMVLDAVIFLGLTRTNILLKVLPSDIIVKTFISALVSIPLGLYLHWYQKKGGLNLNRGSLDIFKKIKDLQGDLAKANEELREYAENLEQKVEERTAEIQEKNIIMAREMQMAADVQQAMLPEEIHLKGVNHHILYEPCSEVSGDIYDFGTRPDGTHYYFLADISGHGVPSALIGAMCRMSFQEAIHTIPDPAAILHHMAEELQQVIGCHFLTSVLLFLKPEERTLVFANGGHNPPLILTNNNQFALLEATGMIIGQGIVDNYTQKKIRYPGKSRLLLYTDCLTEHKNKDREEFGIERLKEKMGETYTLNPEKTVAFLRSELINFGDGEKFSDDLTILLIDLP